MKMLLTLAILCASNAFASSHFDLGVGATFPQTHTDFNNEADTNIAGFFNYRYSTSKRWSFGAGLYHLSFSDTDLNDDALYVLTRYELSPDSRFNTFLLAGLGVANISPEGGHDYARGTAVIGAGVDTQLSDSFRVGLNVNYHHVEKFDDDLVGSEQHIIVPSLFVTYSIGAKHKTKAHGEHNAHHHKHNSADHHNKYHANAKTNDADKDGVIDSRDACPNTAVNTKVNDIGCDIANKDLKLSLNVKFLTGKAKINETSTARVDRLASIMKSNKELKIEVQGHTDSSGPRAFNVYLSQQRADAVKAYLTEKHGIAAERLQAKGYGPDMPKESNATAAGRVANRRVEAKVLSN